MPDATTPPPVRKGRGCLFFGCLTCLMLLLIAGLMAFFPVRFVRNRIADYTDVAPAKLPKVERADAECKQLEARAKSFGDAMDQGKPTEPLVLTERDVNALIANASNTKELANKFHVSLDGEFDLLVLQKLSVPETARTLQASVASVYMAEHRVARLVRKEVQKLERSGR